jgi:hypothetical protein
MDALPVALDRGLSALTFALGTYLVAVQGLLASMAAQRSTLSARARALVPFLVGAFLAVWFGSCIVLGDGRNFPLANDGLRRPLSLAVGFLPMLFGVALLFRTRTLRALNDAMPADWLIRVQVYRALGPLFLFPFLYYGVIPAGFVLPAAIGDFLTGLLAPSVASSVARGRPGARTVAIAWNLFGIADLVVAPVAAILTRTPILNLYPLVLVPLFLGPPVGILTHIQSLRNLRRASQTAPRAVAAVGETVSAT